MQGNQPPHEARGQPRSRAHPGLAILVALATFGAGLTACSTPPAPDASARSLADGLGSGSLASVQLDPPTTSAAATGQLQAATATLTGATRTVRLDTVTVDAEDDAKASASLTTTWDLPGTDTMWTYPVTAGLVLRDDTWKVQWTPALIAPALTATEKLRITRTPPPRASILGASGAVLVQDRDVFQVGIDKAKVSAAVAVASAKALARLVGIDAAGFAERVRTGGTHQLVVAITLRAGDPILDTNGPAIGAIPGAVRVPGKLPLAPTRIFARDVIGSVGPATAEIVARSKGAVQADQIVGTSGLQALYDAQLRGSLGLTVQAVGTAAGGQTVARDLIKVDPVPGTPLATTLDVATQVAADKALSTVSGTASLVAIKVSDGHILAAANAPASAVVAMATTGHAAPGSSFKVVSSLALLRTGLTPSSPIPCTPTITVDGRTFKNYGDYPSGGLGRIPLRTAVANSCNTAFISQQARVSQARLAEAGAALGLGTGDELDLGFPAYLGSVPAEATGTEHAASLIGQGRVEASPLAMATVLASVMRGQTVRPVLLPGRAPSHPAPAVPLTAAEAAALRTLLGAVVSQGSGRALAPLGVTLAKTGTAEYGSATPPKTHGWMVAGRGDIAIAAYVENGASGAKTAGPIIAAFLTALG